MNVTGAPLSLFSKSQLDFIADSRPLYYVARPSLFAWLPDNLFSLAAPVIAYWGLSLFFHLLDISDARWLDQYRIHESAEVKSKNRASRWDVFIAVVFQHVVQTLIGMWWMEDKPGGDLVDHIAGTARKASFVLSLLRTVLGEHRAMSIWLTHGHEMSYFVYWWAIPVSKLILGMYVLFPRIRTPC